MKSPRVVCIVIAISAYLVTTASAYSQVLNHHPLPEELHVTVEPVLSEPVPWPLAAEGEVRPAAFVVVTFDLTTNKLVKAEIRKERVPNLELVLQSSASRASFLMPGGEVPVAQVAFERYSGGQELELLTAAPTFDAEAIVFQGVSPGPVFVPAKAFASAQGPGPGRVANDCDSETTTYRQDANLFIGSTTCFRSGEIIDFKDPRFILSRECYTCFTCWKLWNGPSSPEFCDPPYTKCGTCVGSYGYIPRG